MADPNSPQSPFPAPAGPAAQPIRRQPLPDPLAIRPIAIPQPDPPYDPDQFELIPLAPAPKARSTAPAPRASSAAHFTEQYSIGPWPSQFAQALAETLVGTRPPSQLTPWISVQARRRIRRLSPVLAAAGQPTASQPAASQPTASQPKLRRVIITSPIDGVLEMTVVIGLGQRVRALAVRLERSDSAGEPLWCCTAIEAA
jgi:uncharacterized protein DUF6459